MSNGRLVLSRRGPVSTRGLKGEVTKNVRPYFTIEARESNRARGRCHEGAPASQDSPLALFDTTRGMGSAALADTSQSPLRETSGAPLCSKVLPRASWRGIQSQCFLRSAPSFDLSSFFFPEKYKFSIEKRRKDTKRWKWKIRHLNLECFFVWSLDSMICLHLNVGAIGILIYSCH